MAERRSTRSRRNDEADELPRDLDDDASDDGDAGDRTTGRPRPARRERDARLSAADAAEAGLREIAGLTGKQPEGVTGVEPGDEGWIVGVEVVEDRRVPSSADILAIYETEFDLNGELLSYRRLRRYQRGRGDAGEGS